MFSLLNLIFTIVNIVICCSIKTRVYTYDKFYMITHDMVIREDKQKNQKK